MYRAELERYQDHTKLDDQYPYHGAHGRLTDDLYDKTRIPHIVFNNPSNCKADTKKQRLPKILIFNWTIQSEKVQLTGSMIYQRMLLPCKMDQKVCDPTIRTRAISTNTLTL